MKTEGLNSIYGNGQTFNNCQSFLHLPLNLVLELKRSGEKNHVPLLNYLISGINFLLYRYQFEVDGSSQKMVANLEIESSLGKTREQLELNPILNGKLPLHDLPGIEIFPITNKNMFIKSINIIDLIIYTKETNGYSPYSISVHINGELDIEVYFNCVTSLVLTSIFKNSASHFEKVLCEFANPTFVSVDDFNFLTESQIDEIIKISSGNVRGDLSTPVLLHQIFEQSVSLFPYKIALSCGGQYNINYFDLNFRSTEIAYFLLKSKVGKGDFVGILLPKSPDLYSSILGILKSGAAYVPIDINYPEERIRFILSDCEAKAVITTEQFGPTVNVRGCKTVIISDISVLDKNSLLNIQPEEIELTVDDPAYVIYTSGTTGTPKGVIIPHQSAVNFVRSEREIFKISNTDRVFQGFSIAFDASVEEIWLAFSNGATLVIPDTTNLVESGDDMIKYLEEQNVTVLSTVPTMLSMLPKQADCIRLLILGGEVCTDNLLKDWYKDSRKIFNTYGPTESTVVSTLCEFSPFKKLTIGRPLPNYEAFVLDKNLRLLPAGCIGEIYIGGPVLAKEYIHNEGLTKSKFLNVKFPYKDLRRLYKSGDLGRYNENQELEFLGRADNQVKLRGYRIELSEIENQILQFSGVKNAIVIVRKGQDSIEKIIAYILTKDNQFDFEEALRNQLKFNLAHYMMPSFIIRLDQFPLMPSGKVNQKLLPDPTFENNKSKRNITKPITEAENIICGIWSKHFSPLEISIRDNFFEIGGHSLLASIIVSELRNIPAYQSLSVRDIYSYPILEDLAKYATSQKETVNKNEGAQPDINKVGHVTYGLVGLIQYFFIGLLYTLAACIIVIFRWIFAKYDFGIVELAYTIITLPITYLLFSTLLSIMIKWAIIGRFKEGRYPIWGWYYLRFWIVKRMADLVPTSLISGTPLLNIYLRLMGVKIGHNVYFGSDRIRIFDLISVGEYSSINKEAYLMGYRVEGNDLIIGSIDIGAHSFVGIRAVINENSSIKKGGSLLELSMLPSDTLIPEGETWKGSPAYKTSSQKYNKSNSATGSKILYGLVQTFTFFIAIQMPAIVATILFISLYGIIHYFGYMTGSIALLPLSAFYVIIYALLIACVKNTLIRPFSGKSFSIYSAQYSWKWLEDTLMNQSLSAFKSLYATIYLPGWLRLMGVKIGKGSEISTVNQISPNLLHIGTNSFLADSVSIGSSIVRDNIMYLDKTEIGNKTFIGNGAVLPAGTTIGNNILIGVCSTAPTVTSKENIDGSSWIGSPAMYLPTRETSESFPDNLTFSPSKIRIFYRGLVEFFKIILPYYITAIMTYVFYLLYLKDLVFSNHHLFKNIAIIILGLLLSGFISCLVTVLFKWVLVGKITPKNKPLWNIFVWKNELVNSLCECMAYPLFVNNFLGTPLASLFFRAMGSKIGKRVFMESTEITEFDLVHIGNDVALNQGCILQSHLFEDRIMKMNYLLIGNNCSVGPASIVLYSSEMHEGSILKSLSLLMKGESLNKNTSWQGLPARFYGKYK